VSTAEFYSGGSPVQKRYRYVFGTSSYDALNRLKSADFSHYSGGWVTTAAHDLANITYDAAGNLTALQRYRETGTLIDNLTYSYPGSSNRLSSVADAINTTSETWDAEDGSFTYDANGNMKTAPAPYSLSAITYDHQNLPTSLTRSGTTTTYRYDAAGMRISKQVASGNTEVYLRDGSTTLGVFTVNGSGSLTSWHFNLLAGEQVIGRQPHTGNRRYYHTDLLGSTRAVVEGATIVESYDFEPWGLLMPGRTLGSGTKEGFTTKERDLETGLDYFGARYYMAALGRWTSTDPLRDNFPAWSPYNYALNNPSGAVDPDGEAPWIIGALIGASVELGGQVVMGLASGKSFVESVTSVDLADVGTAAVAGAVTGGLSALRTLGTGAKVAVTVATSVTEGATKAHTGSSRTDYDLADALIDAALPIGVGAAADEVAGSLRNTARGRALADDVRRAENIAAEGRPRPAQTRRAQAARTRLENYGRGHAAQTVQAAATGSAAAVLNEREPASSNTQTTTTPVLRAAPVPPPPVVRRSSS
jgi:RHS repeat-associated protein